MDVLDYACLKGKLIGFLSLERNLSEAIHVEKEQGIAGAVFWSILHGLARSAASFYGQSYFVTLPRTCKLRDPVLDASSRWAPGLVKDKRSGTPGWAHPPVWYMETKEGTGGLPLRTFQVSRQW